MKNLFRIKHVEISIIVTVVIGLIFVPVKVIGSFAKIYDWVNLVTYIDNKMKICTDCYRLTINYLVYIPELIIVFFISLFILNLLKKKGIIK